jgi:hypothetical protein
VLDTAYRWCSRAVSTGRGAPGGNGQNQQKHVHFTQFPFPFWKPDFWMPVAGKPEVRRLPYNLLE